MPRPDVQTLVNRLIEAALRERRAELSKSYGRLKGEASAKGRLQSGFTSVALTDLTRLELRARAALGWETTQSVLSDTGVVLDNPTIEELKATVAHQIQSHERELAADLVLAMPHGLLRSNDAPLAEEGAALRDEYEAKIDLFAAKYRAQVPNSQVSPVFNFHGSVGAVQTGSGSVANVNTTISESGLEQMSLAVKQLQTLLASAPDIQDSTRVELHDTAEIVSVELRTEKPSRLRVTSLASGLAQTIQAVGSLQPAYLAIKTALAHFGISIP